MDFYGDCSSSSKLAFNGEVSGFEDLLDNDVWTPSSPSEHSSSVMESTGLDSYSMDPDWLDSFLEDPVLNDRMMSDALQPPQPISNEHSYSLANNDGTDMDTIKHEPVDNDLEKELIKTSKPLNLTIHKQNQAAAHHHQGQIESQTFIKQEDTDEITTATDQIQTVTVTTTRAGQTILRQPTIILATTPGSTPGTVTTATIKHADRLVLPKVHVKLEPQERAASPDDMSVYDGLSLPPTPPSSASSDSEGGMSPQRSAPSSPIRHLHHQSNRHNPLRSTHHIHSAAAASLFSSPIPTSGVLILSEEEKRTLISEGYPIPTKLPLTKQEEKNLKKVRRKIKNKISAQESRRKKKEYLETLEKKVEAYNQENVDLKRKMETLETNNRSLLSQLQKLQSLVGKVTPSVNTTPTNTCLMVLVLCFAVFMGSWSSGFASLGYSTFGGVVAPQSLSTPVGRVLNRAPIGPKVEDATVDAYSTPNMRSRVLLSMMDEDEEYGPPTPFSYKDLFLRFFCSSDEGASDTASDNNNDSSQRQPLEPSMPESGIAGTVPKAGEEEPEQNIAAINDTAEKLVQYQEPIHPDIMADVRANVPIEKRQMSATTA